MLCENLPVVLCQLIGHYARICGVCLSTLVCSLGVCLNCEHLASQVKEIDPSPYKWIAFMDRNKYDVFWRPVQSPTLRLCACLSEVPCHYYKVECLSVWNNQLYLQFHGCEPAGMHIVVFEDGLLGHKWSYAKSTTGKIAMSLLQESVPENFTPFFCLVDQWKDDVKNEVIFHDGKSKLISSWRANEEEENLALAEHRLARFEVPIRSIFIVSQYYRISFHCELSHESHVESLSRVGFLLDTGCAIRQNSTSLNFFNGEVAMSLLIVWEYVDLRRGCDKLTIWLKESHNDDPLSLDLSNCYLGVERHATRFAFNGPPPKLKKSKKRALAKREVWLQ